MAEKHRVELERLKVESSLIEQKLQTQATAHQIAIQHGIQKGSRAGKNIGLPTSLDPDHMIVKLVAGATLMDTYYHCHSLQPDNPQLLATLESGAKAPE